MIMNLKRLLGFLSLYFFSISESTVPTGCSYDSTDSVGVYTCDFAQLGFPLVFYGFSPAPQRLKLKNINGNLPASGTFSGFNSYSSASFDTNYAASLELECLTSAAASLTIAGATFAGMGYVQEFKITNCYTSSFPNGVFSNIAEVDSLVITGGTAAGLTSDSFTGLSIKNLSIPNSQSLFEMSNTVLPGGTLPANLLSGFTDVKRIVLDNIGLTSISASDISSNTMITHLSLKHNSFTTIPSGLFTGIDGLNLLDVTGIDWDCSCDNLWFLEYAITNGIEITEGVICNTPTSYLEKRAQLYYKETCVVTDVCEGKSGIGIGTYCMVVWDLAAYIILIITLIASLLALGLLISTRKMIIEERTRMAKKKESSWKIIEEALRRRDGAGKKPPDTFQCLIRYSACRSE